MSQGVVRSMAEGPASEVARAKGATVQVVLGPDDHVPRFYTRRFTIEPGGHIPCHRHDTIEHEQVVIEGEMRLLLEGKEHLVGAGDCVYIPAGVAHAYRNSGAVPVRFLCIIPAVTDYNTEWL
jgi:quercetin dioxygenase-like cupin family protein